MRIRGLISFLLCQMTQCVSTTPPYLLSGAMTCEGHSIAYEDVQSASQELVKETRPTP